MRREIAEQPAAVAATLAEVAAPAAALAAAVRERGLDRVVLVARGTSDHVAIYARYLLEARCALSASLAAPSLYTTYRPPVDLSRALVLGVSQSGQTPEIVAALEFAAERGALTAALTNDAGSPLAGAGAHALVTAAGEERSVAATKTFTTALAVIAELARALGASRPRRRRSQALPAALERGGGAAGRARRARPRARCSTPRRRSASRAATPTRRRSRRRSSSRRSTGLWAEGFSAADLRHGPRAAALGLPALVFHCGRPARRATSTGSSASSRPPARRSSRSAPAGRCRPPRGCARSSRRSR